MMLTEIEIDKLFAFCRKHYIHYYEVQAEIVDHFAGAIERGMEADPLLSFEQALENVYTSFGGWKGLQQIQSERKRSVVKQQGKMKLQIFLSYFRLPKLMLTLMLVAVSYVFQKYLDPRFTAILFAITVLIAFAWEVSLIKQSKKISKNKKENLLLLQDKVSVILVVVIFFSFNGLMNTVFDPILHETSTGNHLPFFILFPLYYITVNSLREYRQKINTKAMELYPELFVANSFN
jgi:hypothetical protein